MRRNEKLVLERIAVDLKDHVVCPLKADGLYRHWRCRRLGTWCMGFDIVTWPGSLCFTGDMGDFLFQRVEDMVDFCKRVCRGDSFDYAYMAQKCVAGKESIKEWSEEKFKEELIERRGYYDNECEGKVVVVRQGSKREESVHTKINEILNAYEEYSSQHDALKAMYESGLWDELPSCEVYSVQFLWALHAIKWFCKRV